MSIERITSAWLSAALFCLVGVGTTVLADNSEAGSVADPSAATDIIGSGFRRDLQTGELTQLVTIVNRTDQPLEGPLVLIVDGVTGATKVAGGTKTKTGRAGKAFSLEGSRAGGGLEPKGKSTLVLRFAGAEENRVKYSAHVARAAK